MRPGRVVIATACVLLAVAGAVQCSSRSSPPPGTVTGRILAENGQPVAGALVSAWTSGGSPADGGSAGAGGGGTPMDGGAAGVPDGGPGSPATATSDAAGGFTLHVQAPYDLDVVMPSGTHGIRYQGLSNGSPIFVAVGETVGPGPVNAASISGSVDGGAVSPAGGVPSGTVSWITYGSAGTQAVAALAPAGGPYSLGVSWQGSASIDGGVAAIQYQADGGAPVTYSGYGERNGVSVADGGVVSGADVTLGPVAQGSVAGTFQLPDSTYSIHGKAVLVTLPNGARVPLGSDSTVTPGFGFVLPAIDGGVGAVNAIATDTAGGTAIAIQFYPLPPAADGGTIQIPSAPGQTAPADGATGVTRATPFSWTGCTGVALVEMVCSTATVQTFHVLTGASSITPPDFGAGGPSLPRSAPCTWTVECHPYLTSMDAATGPGGYPTNATFWQPNTGYQVSRTPARSFTTSATP